MTTAMIAIFAMLCVGIVLALVCFQTRRDYKRLNLRYIELQHLYKDSCDASARALADRENELLSRIGELESRSSVIEQKPSEVLIKEEQISKEKANSGIARLNEAILRKQRELSALSRQIEEKRKKARENEKERLENFGEELKKIELEIKERRDYLDGIRKSSYYETDDYIKRVASKVGMVAPDLIESAIAYEVISDELKLRMSDTKENIKNAMYATEVVRQPFAFVWNSQLTNEDCVRKCLSAVCVRYIDMLVNSLVKNPYKQGLEKSLQCVAKSVATVERFFPVGLKIHVPDAYIAAKKEEIKLAYEIEEYKARQAEERKLSLQAQREELAAQREIERELKRAQKDEQEAQVKLERRRIELAQAKSAAEIARLNDHIQKLQAAIDEAQQRHERALSMAQQTRAGYVYVISNIGSFGEGVYKIGMTRRVEPMERVVELGDASVPFPFDVHAMIWSEDAPELEASLHRAFDDRKVNAVNGRKEFFRVSLDEVRSVLKDMDIDARLIDSPQAVQYRDTLAIRAIAE